MTKLADSMMLDLFKATLEFRLPDESELKQLVSRIWARLPAEKRKDAVLFLTPADRPKSIIDAKASVACDACGVVCWVSPSSRARLETATRLCLACLEKEAGW